MIVERIRSTRVVRTRSDAGLLHADVSMSDGTADEIEGRQEQKVVPSQHEEDPTVPPFSFFQSRRSPQVGFLNKYRFAEGRYTCPVVSNFLSQASTRARANPLSWAFRTIDS